MYNLSKGIELLTQPYWLLDALHVLEEDDHDAAFFCWSETKLLLHDVKTCPQGRGNSSIQASSISMLQIPGRTKIGPRLSR